MRLKRYTRRRAAGAFVGIVLALGVYLQTGCNLFSFAADDDPDNLTYRGLILKGNEAIRGQRYSEAITYFEHAKNLNVQGSEAYWYHSKAIMSQYHLDYNVLNDSFEVHRSHDSLGRGSAGQDSIYTKKGRPGIPFVDSNTTLRGIDSVYHPVAVAVKNLEHILRQKQDSVSLSPGFSLPPDGDTAGDGVISKETARLDVGLLQAVKAILAPNDLDGNGYINDSCGLGRDNPICPLNNGTDSTAAPGCMASDKYLKVCRTGLTSERDRFERYKKLTKYIDIQHLDSKDVQARNVSVNPGDINGFIDAMQGPIAGSNYNLDSVTGVMNSHGDQKLSGQLQGMVGDIKDLSNFLGYMRYNDASDNDFDSKDTAHASMLWHDYDKDGGIRFDYGTMEAALFAGYPALARNIGHPIHRYVHPTFYLRYSELLVRYPALKGDTSDNSRISLMRKKCKEITDSLPIAGSVSAGVKAGIRSLICDSISTILNSSVARPPQSDWVGGTAGVDEEMIDDKDNDYDGIKDEDSRLLKGFDDDDDALLNINMVGTMPLPMDWTDLNGNTCPDINRSLVDTTYAARTGIVNPDANVRKAYRRAFCIGSLEHRLHIARRDLADGITANDSLRIYYSAFSLKDETERTLGNTNCREDIEKLDPVYLAAQFPSAPPPNLNLTPSQWESRIKDEKAAACFYKHIPVASTWPGSEWTTGTYGIDEELKDGVDNDGDGWIDEDLK